MKIRVTKETDSGLKPGVYDAHKHNGNVFAHQPIGISTLVLNHYISTDNYEIVPRPASGMGERIMTTTNTLTCATMLHQGFNVRVRDTKTGRYVKWDDTVINTNGSRPTTIDYHNHDTTLRFAMDTNHYIQYYHQNGFIGRQVLNVNKAKLGQFAGKVTFDETYDFANYDITHQRENKHVFEIFA